MPTPRMVDGLTHVSGVGDQAHPRNPLPGQGSPTPDTTKCEAGMAKRVCSVDGCPTITDGGRCTDHTRAADRARGTSRQRGYATPGHRRFRRLVLKRDPVCVICGQVATVADHWPVSRRDLEAQGLNPNDPNAGRGLCRTCHSRETATNPEQRGGWNDDGWRLGLDLGG